MVKTTTATIGTILVTFFLIGCNDQPIAASSGPAQQNERFVVRNASGYLEDPKVFVCQEGSTLNINVISPGGIGDAQIEKMSGNWPENIVVHLRYSETQTFSIIEGAIASLLKDASPNATQIFLMVKRKPANDGFQIAQPINDNNMTILHISWVDMYRE